MYCKHCGAELPEQSKFCNNCGKSVFETNSFFNDSNSTQTKDNLNQQSINNDTTNYQPYHYYQNSEITNNKSSLKSANRVFNQKSNKPTEIVVRKKSGCLTVIGIIFIFILIVVIAGIAIVLSDDDTATDTTHTTMVANNKKAQISALQKQFKAIGLSSDEAKQYAKIFYKLGLKEISGIEALTGITIDDLLGFRCKVYDYDSAQVNFTIEKRKLIYVQFAGKYYPNGYFEEPEYVSVDMYDRMDKNGDIDYNKQPFLSVLDYENNKFIKYEKKE